MKLNKGLFITIVLAWAVGNVLLGALRWVNTQVKSPVQF